MIASLAHPAWKMAGTVKTQTSTITAGLSGQAVDADLLEQVVAGDRTALADVVNRYHAIVFRVAVRVFGNAAEAEDIAQEVFLKLWRKPPDLRNKAALRPWLLQVARNLAIDRLRQVRNTSDDGLELIEDGASAPDGRLRHAEAVEQVTNALAGLPERQRTALQLTYYEGLSNIEAAEIMQASVEAVESLLSRARRSLRAGLEPVWTELIQELEQLK
jgi:RNA polymerase sigma-70 factor (ECF subfamily)